MPPIDRQRLLRDLSISLARVIVATIGTPRGELYLALNALAFTTANLIAHAAEKHGGGERALAFFHEALTKNILANGGQLVCVDPPPA